MAVGVQRVQGAQAVMKIKTHQRVHYWYSASEVSSVIFVRWCVMRMQTWGKDTNKLGVGAIVRSDWLFSRGLRPRIDWGLKRGQARLRPCWTLYRTREQAYQHKNPIRRLSIEEVRRLDRRRLARRSVRRLEVGKT